MNNFLPPDVINPISGCTREEEIEKAFAIGGHLPFDAYESMIRRRVVPKGNRRKNVSVRAKKNSPLRKEKYTE